MNPNVWNIKEILSIPARNASSSGYSSSTDSQYMLGSQETIFCRNSQPSQQSSEGSDPTFLNNYHTKPLLFGTDGKDLHSRAVGVLDKFEEDKRREKEKRESDFLTKERFHLRETLNQMQHAVSDTEKNTAACKTVLERFDSFATALEKNLSGLHNSITQNFEKMLTQISSQKQLLTEMEENVLKTGLDFTELGSRVKDLERNVEVLTQEPRREQDKLEEAVTLLNTLVSRHSTKPIPVRVTDTAIQTSPGLTVNTIQTSPGLTVNRTRTSPGLTVNTTQTSPGLAVNTTQTSPALVVNTSQTSPGLTVNTTQTSPGLTDSMIQASTELSQTLFNQEQKCLPENNRLPLWQGEVPSQNQSSCIKLKSRSTAQCQKKNKRKLMPSRRKGTILCENRQNSSNKITQGVSLLHDPKSAHSVKSDHQSKGVVGLEPEPHSKSLINNNPGFKAGLVSQVKSRSHQQSGGTRSNIGPITPFNIWSQESTSSPRVTVLPGETRAEISEKPKGLWQLFDASDPFSGDE